MKKKNDKTTSIEPSSVIKTTNDLQPEYTSKAIKPKSDVPKDIYGNAGVRASLTNAGLDDDKIGYDGEYVTYSGSRILKPEYESEGTSYSKQSDINKAIGNAYSMNGVRLAPIAELAASYGVPQYAAKYENGNVYIGGRSVPSAYESNGIAYGSEDKIKEAADWYRNATGAVSFADIKNNYDNYKAKTDELLEKYLSSEEWSYDPQSDTAYNSYAAAAQREGMKAYENALGSMMAKTGGNMNSAAATAATQGMNNYLEKIQDKIPEFMSQSYDRYIKERDADRNDIKLASDSARESLADYLSISDKSNEFNRQNGADEFGRKNDEHDLLRNEYYSGKYSDILGLDMNSKQEDITGKSINNIISNADIPYANDMAREKYAEQQQKTIGIARENDSKALENNKTAIENNMNFTETIYKNAIMRGYFLPDEADYLNIDPTLDPVELYRRFLTVGSEK